MPTNVNFAHDTSKDMLTVIIAKDWRRYSSFFDNPTHSSIQRIRKLLKHCKPVGCLPETRGLIVYYTVKQ